MGMPLPSELEINCSPISSCPVQVEITDFIWEIQYFRSQNWIPLNVGKYEPPENVIEVTSGDGDVNIVQADMTLQITDITEAMIGFYRVRSATGHILSSFTLFSELCMSVSRNQHAPCFDWDLYAQQELLTFLAKVE